MSSIIEITFSLIVPIIVPIRLAFYSAAVSEDTDSLKYPIGQLQIG